MYIIKLATTYTLNLYLISGAERLLNHLHRHKIPMALATASHQTQFDLKTEKHLELFQRVFDYIVTGDQV